MFFFSFVEFVALPIILQFFFGFLFAIRISFLNSYFGYRYCSSIQINVTKTVSLLVIILGTTYHMSHAPQILHLFLHGRDLLEVPLPGLLDPIQSLHQHVLLLFDLLHPLQHVVVDAVLKGVPPGLPSAHVGLLLVDPVRQLVLWGCFSVPWTSSRSIRILHLPLVTCYKKKTS